MRETLAQMAQARGVQWRPCGSFLARGAVAWRLLGLPPMKSFIFNVRARRCLVAATLAGGLHAACAIDPQRGEVLGSGGVGVIQYSTTDLTTPTYWGVDPNGMSSYFGAGGDSVQPELQPRPEHHADRIALVGDDEIASLAVDWPSRSAEVRVAPMSVTERRPRASPISCRTPSGASSDGDAGAFFRRFGRSESFRSRERCHRGDPSGQRNARPSLRNRAGARARGVRVDSDRYRGGSISRFRTARRRPWVGHGFALVGDALVLQAGITARRRSR
jgi:hypothetical protein